VGSDPIGEIARRLAWTFVGAAVMDAADEGLTGFGRRFPRALRFARIVGGASLVLVGVLEAGAVVLFFADVAYGEGAASLFLLIPLAFGVGLTVWGLGMMRRGWASRGVVGTATIRDSYSSAGGRLIPESHNVGAPTASWLRMVFVFALWIAGSVIAILAGVSDGYAMLLGSLLPITAYLVYRRRRAAGRY
jgi:hypothetical protein